MQHGRLCQRSFRYDGAAYNQFYAQVEWGFRIEMWHLIPLVAGRTTIILAQIIDDVCLAGKLQAALGIHPLHLN